MKLSIVMPAHNEEDRLSPVLKHYACFFDEKLGNEAEIILVANGCSDNTADVAVEIAKNHDNIRVIDEPRRIGKGGAVIEGVKAACGDYVGFVDADGATAPEEFLRLYEKAVGRDGIIASRWIKGADVTIPQRAMRLLSSRLFNGLTRILLGLRYKDTQCGAKIFTRKAWENVLPNIGITRFAFDVDVLFQLKRHGYDVMEEPTVWRDIEGSKVRFFNTSFDMFLAIVRMRLFYSPFRFIVRIYEKLFARIVEYLRRDELFRHATILFMASMVMHVCNIGYQMVVSRALPKEEYALLATFLALFAVFVRPLRTLGTAITHYSSILANEGRAGAIRRLIFKWSSISGIPSLLLCVVCIYWARPIAAYFHLNRVEPVIVSALALPILFIAPVLGGPLRGLQRFGWASIVSGFGGISKLLLGAVFVYAVFPACGWALAGHVGSMYVANLLTVGVLFFLLKPYGRDRASLPSLRFYILQCFFIQTCTALLVTGDVILVKHYLPKETDFAYAATLGRMVVFMAVAVISAMFPKVSSKGAFSREQRSIYFRSMLYTSIVVLLSTFCCLFIPAFMLRILFSISNPSDHLIWLTRWFSLVMFLATLLNINISLLLAQRRFKLASITVPATVLYLGGVHFMHPNAYAVIGCAAVAILLALVVTTIGILRTQTQD